MNLLSKAKDFFARKASTLAIAAVPLAVWAVAVPAKATTMTLDPNGTDTCTAFLSGSCSLSTNPTGGNTFLNQVVLTGTATPSGNTAELLVATATASSSFGPLPPIGSAIPVSWDFTISGLDSGSVQWEAVFGVYFGAGGFNEFLAHGTTGNGEVTGNGSIILGASGDLSKYTIELSATSSGGSFTLSAPLTLNSAVPSPVPEPGSLLLMGAGGAALFLVRRKKRV